MAVWIVCFLFVAVSRTVHMMELVCDFKVCRIYT